MKYGKLQTAVFMIPAAKYSYERVSAQTVITFNVWLKKILEGKDEFSIHRGSDVDDITWNISDEVLQTPDLKVKAITNLITGLLFETEVYSEYNMHILLIDVSVKEDGMFDVYCKNADGSITLEFTIITHERRKK